MIIYRVLSPAVPLERDCSVRWSLCSGNTSQVVSLAISGFYQASTTPVPAAKLTSIVANGQSNKLEQVYLNAPGQTTQPLASLYGTQPPFPGIYGNWDNPTWLLSKYNYVNPNDSFEPVSVVPNSSNKGCVTWEAQILSTTVQDSDGDGLLDTWETHQGLADGRR